MNRKLSVRERALAAARELIDTLDLPVDEKRLIFGIALDRFESVRTTLESLGVCRAAVSAVFAAALEYSETMNGNSIDSPDE